MAYGVNRVGKQTRASFQLVNNIVKFQHPFLLGQLANGKLDEIDVTACLVMDNEPFNAEPDSESAKTIKMLDGSTVTVCNKNLSGAINLKAVETTGKVATGDFIAACKLVKSLGDSVGGLLTVIRRLGSDCLVTVFYGVTVVKCPDLKLSGVDVAVYPITLSYSGYLEANGTQEQALQHIWTVGNNLEVEAIFKPIRLDAASTLIYGIDTGAGYPFVSSPFYTPKLPSDSIEDKDLANESLLAVDLANPKTTTHRRFELLGVQTVAQWGYTKQSDGSFTGILDGVIRYIPNKKPNS